MTSIKNHYYRVERYLSSRLRGRPNPFEPRWVPPESIQYATPPSEYTDLNQHDADRDHPHAHYNRGYFDQETRLGSVMGGDWDDPDLKFTTLLEYKALKKKFKGDQPWRESKFAERSVNYINKGGTSRGYSDPEKLLNEREKELESLFESIKNEGLYRNASHFLEDGAFDQIGVNVTRNGEILYNNRGTHRISISKLLDIDYIPVVVVVWHENWVEKNGFNIPCER